MGITILPSTAPRTVKRLVTTIYGDTGVGKTTLAMSASNPLLLDFEEGEERAIGTADLVRVTKWDDVKGLRGADVEPYDTVIVDTVGTLLQQLFIHLLRADRKLGTRTGAPTIQGWMALGSSFRLWLAQLRSRGVDIVMLAHAKEEQQGEDTKIRPDITGQSRQEVYALSHIIGLLAMDEQNRRVLDCRPMFRHHGKNPPQWDPMLIPDWTHDDRRPVMADLLADAKKRMSRPAATPLPLTPTPHAPDTARNPGASAATEKPSLNSLNHELTELLARNAGRAEKGALWMRAKDAGFVFDKESVSFIPAWLEEETE